MAYDCELNVLVHLGQLKNVDILHKGLYFVRITLFQEDKTDNNLVSLETHRIACISPISLFSAASTLNSYVRDSQIPAAKQSDLCCIDESGRSFCSRTFVIRYKDEIYDLNEGGIWKLDLRCPTHTESFLPAVKEFRLQFDLMMASFVNNDAKHDLYNKIDQLIPDDPIYQLVSRQTLVLKYPTTGFHEYFPIQFHRSYWMQLDCMIHCSLTNIHGVDDSFKLIPTFVNNPIRDGLSLSDKRSNIAEVDVKRLIDEYSLIFQTNATILNDCKELLIESNAIQSIATIPNQFDNTTQMDQLVEFFHKCLEPHYNSRFLNIWNEIIFFIKQNMIKIRNQLKSRYLIVIQRYWRNQMMIQTKSIDGSVWYSPMEYTVQSNIFMEHLNHQEEVSYSFINDHDDESIVSPSRYLASSLILYGPYGYYEKGMYDDPLPRVYDADLHQDRSLLPIVLFQQYAMNVMTEIVHSDASENSPSSTPSLKSLGETDDSSKWSGTLHLANGGKLLYCEDSLYSHNSMENCLNNLANRYSLVDSMTPKNQSLPLLSTFQRIRFAPYFVERSSDVFDLYRNEIYGIDLQPIRPVVGDHFVFAVEEEKICYFKDLSAQTITTTSDENAVSNDIQNASSEMKEQEAKPSEVDSGSKNGFNSVTTNMSNKEDQLSARNNVKNLLQNLKKERSQHLNDKVLEGITPLKERQRSFNDESGGDDQLKSSAVELRIEDDIVCRDNPHIEASNLERRSESSMIPVHLIVLQHGYLGGSYDMKLLQNAICMQFSSPDVNIVSYTARSNESPDNQKDSITQMAKRFAFEVIQYCKGSWPELLEPSFSSKSKISLIGHSMGGLIIRKALEEPGMKPILSKLHSYISLATPHLGTAFSESQLVSAGAWAMFKLRKSKCLRELVLEDAIAGKLNKSFLFKLSENGVLSLFRHVILVSCPQDLYVPIHSARIQMSSKISSDNTSLGKALKPTIETMTKNLLDSLKYNQIVRITLHNLTSYNYPEVSLQQLKDNQNIKDLKKIHNNSSNGSGGIVGRVEAMIGRYAHISYLQNPVVATQLIISLHDFLK